MARDADTTQLNYGDAAAPDRRAEAEDLTCEKPTEDKEEGEVDDSPTTSQPDLTLPPRPAADPMTAVADLERSITERRNSALEHVTLPGGTRLALLDSWVAARDRTWAPPPLPLSSPEREARKPATFRGELTLDSWIAGRDGRDWREPGRTYAPVHPVGRKRARGRVGGYEGLTRSGRTSPAYAPYGRARGGRRGGGGQRRRTPERAGRRVVSESEDRRTSRRDGMDAYGRSPARVTKPLGRVRERGRERRA